VRVGSAVLKHLIEVVVATISLILFAPVMMVIGIAVCWSSPGPAIFGQHRPGKQGKPFTLYKFRTMRLPEHGEDPALTDGVRLTRFGCFLRRTSLDELPQLWNVLRGELSLVGPRPLLVQYSPYLTPRERLRETVPPGITGWAQVNGRNLSTWTDRLAHDVWYVENRTIGLDVKILFMTVLGLLSGHRVVVDARSVMKNLDEERRGQELCDR
jgi:lipopolysaccharide/colanic/teichoic acid biosynthesis glycosyltransferase